MFDSDVRCIAAPILNLQRDVLGVLGISGPASRMTKENIPVLAGEVVKIGQSLSQRLRFEK